MITRQATQNDISQISALENDCFSDAWSGKELENILSNPLYDLYVLEVSGEVVGYFASMTVDDCELLRICVKESMRGRGYATALLEKLIDVSARRDAQRILLEVRHTNIEAIRLYEKFGFAEFGVRKNYYGGNVDARLFAYVKGEAELL